jgi:hypothetical protein
LTIFFTESIYLTGSGAKNGKEKDKKKEEKGRKKPKQKEQGLESQEDDQACEKKALIFQAHCF